MRRQYLLAADVRGRFRDRLTILLRAKPRASPDKTSPNRGRAKTEDPVMKFLCRLGDNGVVWNVLSYWRAFEPGAFEAGATTVF